MFVQKDLQELAQPSLLHDQFPIAQTVSQNQFVRLKLVQLALPYAQQL